jgi:hypothetical protein
MVMNPFLPLGSGLPRRRPRPVSGSLMAGTLLVSSLLASTLVAVDVQAEEVVITDKARAHFRAGVNMLQDPDGARYAEAYREFKAAYADSPSWKILGNLGIAAMKLERDGEAIEALRTYLAQGGSQLDAGERNQVQRDLETLEAGVVWVTLSTAPPGARLTDTRTPLAGRPIVNRYTTSDEPLKIGLHPGSHTIVAELDGFESAQWSFDAAPGSTFEQTLDLKEKAVEAPQPQVVTGGGMADTAPHRPVPTSVYVSLATAGALAAGGAVTGVLALGKQRDYQNTNDGTDPDSANDLRGQGQTLNLVTDLLLGSALVAGGAAAFFYFTRPEVKPESRVGLTVAPSALPGGGGLWMQGRF